MIEIVNLTKYFNGNLVLDNLNLNIASGKTLVIIGRSGCGKSVLLKHVVGILRPTSGQVIIEGVDIDRLEGKELRDFRMQFGMLFQGAALFDSLTVGENVGFALYEHSDLPKSQIEKRISECLNMVGLNGIEHLKPAELSGGMRKRVGLARAICVNPKIILYDEPTTGLDPIMADAINDLIIDIKKKLNMTSIVVTHDMTSAYKIADKIAMLYHGKIIGFGTPDEIKNTTSPIIRQFITGAAIGPITEHGGTDNIS